MIRYALALGVVAAAILLRLWTSTLFELMVPYLIVYPAVLLIALLAGLGPGLVAGVCACVASEYFLVEPLYTWDYGTGSWIRLAIVMGSAVCLGLLGRRFRVGQLRARAERKAAEDLSGRTVRRFELLARSAEQLLQSREPQKVVESLCWSVMEHLGCDAFFNFLVDEEAGKLRLNACAGIREDIVRSLEWLDYGVAVCGCAARDGRRIVSEHIPSRPDPRTDLVKSFGIKAYACHPLMGPGGEVLGTLSFGTRTRETFSGQDLSLMKAVTDQVASAITRIRNEDILRKSEEESRRRAEELQRLMEIVPAAIWVAHDPQCARITGNRRANEIYEAVADENVSATTRPERRRFFQDGRELDPAELPMQLAADTNTDVPDSELEVLLPSGRRRAMVGAASPLRDADGRVRGCVGAFLDITERRRAQMAVREWESRLRLAIAAGRMGTWDWQVGTQLDWSDGHYALLGYQVGEIEASVEAFRRRVHPDDLERQCREERESMEEHREYLCEHRVVWPDGSVHWLEARGRYVYDEGGTAVRMYGVLIDVDERRRLQDQRLSLLEAERAARMESEQLVRLKDEFLATVSHELRSPLSAIVGWTGLLAKGKADSGKALDIIRRSASSLTQIVEDLLDMSRIVSGKIRLKRETVDLLEVVNNVVEGIQFTADAKSIAVKVSFDPQPAPIEADPTRIQQVIWNLLTNAIKFTPEHGQVQLSVGQSGRSVIITVSDTGKGIAPEFLPHIFERFRQEDGGIARKHGGLGLGLSIVKHVAELHGGSIEARSEGEGKGSTFVVTLPVGTQQDDLLLRPSFTRPLRENSADLDEQTLAGIKILGVDDDPFTRELLARVLSDAGAVVRTAESPDQAYAALEDFRPDLLISDVGMPGEDGYAFIQTLRSAADWRARLPAIAVTAFSRPEDHQRALRSGFDEHVGKPFDPGLLCMAVLKLLPGRRAAQAGSHAGENGSSNGRGNGRTNHDGVARSSSACPAPPNDPDRARHILLPEHN